MTLIRREGEGEAAAIADVHRRAFAAGDGPAEPVEVRLVDELRRSPAWQPRLSLVALHDGDIVGHVVCSRAVLEPRAEPVLGLGPIGVHPQHQRRGIGAALMHAVLAAADACDEALVGLVGEPAYYRRFGFVPAARLGIESPEPSWTDYFQARTLTAYDHRLRGRFRYAPPFDGL